MRRSNVLHRHGELFQLAHFHITTGLGLDCLLDSLENRASWLPLYDWPEDSGGAWIAWPTPEQKSIAT
ncbi:MAG: hypothetical protein AAF989_07155 [Planctomycetota bacterium]